MNVRHYTIAVHGPPDERGRAQFTLTWPVDDAPVHDTRPGFRHLVVGRGPGIRGQVFHADPHEHAERLRADGYPVTMKHTYVAGAA